MLNLSDQAKEARRAYKRAYREKNRDRINAYQREWLNRPENEGKREEYEARHWERMAEKEAVHG